MNFMDDPMSEDQIGMRGDDSIILSKEATTAILNMARNPSLETQLESLTFLAQVTQGDESTRNHQALLEEPQLGSLLVKLLGSSNKHIVRCTVSILANLSTNAGFLSSPVWGAVRGARLRFLQESKRLRFCVCQLLSNLSRSKKSTRVIEDSIVQTREEIDLGVALQQILMS